MPRPPDDATLAFDSAAVGSTLSPDPPTEQFDPRPLPAVPGYTVERELGRGGMGVVYQARQHALNRTVALKMVLAGAHAKAGDLVRFLTEAETAARLHHQGIVPVYDSGRFDGLPYFTMEFVDGGSLADRLAAGPVAPADAARVALALAEAVASAHAVGVVHRDLKPGNILLAADGTPKITDFGLARRLDAGSGFTETGSVLGTPSYMPPEQARGDTHAVGPAGDVYSLGAILYELLTGHPPFRADTAVSTLSLVLNAVPAAPGSVRRGVPRDLETVALKCLEKSPERRYGSAAALAGDLRRFLDGRPITARRVGPVERLRRWAKRNPAVAGLTAAVFVLLTAGVVVSSAFAVRAEDNAAQARQETARADANAAAAREAEQAARDAERDRTEQLWRTLIDRARAGRMSGQAGQRYDGLAALRQAAAIRPTLEIRNEAIACLALVDLRPAGAGGAPAAPPAADPGGRRVSGGADPSRLVVLARDGRPERELEHPAHVQHAAWRGDGRFLAVACLDNTIHVWRMPEGQRQTVLRGSQARPVSLAFDPSGRVLCSAELGGAVRLWDPVTGQPLVWSARPDTPFRFDAAGRLVGPAGRAWEVAADRECRVLHHSLDGMPDGTGGLRNVWAGRFDATGARLITTGWAPVLWDPEAGAARHRVEGPNGCRSVFLPDGGWLEARNQDVFRWPAAPPFEPQGAPLYTLHPDTLRRPRAELGAVSPDGQWVSVADPGAGRAVLLPLRAGREPVVLDHAHAWQTAFSPDGTLLATGGDGLKVWAVPSGRLLHADRGVGMSRFAFTPDGRWLVNGSGAEYAFRRVGSWEVGRRIPIRGPHAGGALAFSPSGRLMAATPEPVTVKLFDPETGAELAALTPPAPVRGDDLCFSPDGSRLVVATGTGVAHLWDIRLIRRQLREMNLDWEPPLDAPPAAGR